jgi:hypothetical protein
MTSSILLNITHIIIIMHLLLLLLFPTKPQPRHRYSPRETKQNHQNNEQQKTHLRPVNFNDDHLSVVCNETSKRCKAIFYFVSTRGAAPAPPIWRNSSPMLKT